MKVIDILIDACSLLGMKSEKAILSGLSSDTVEKIEDNEKINELHNLFKYSVRELCTHYVPMINSVEIESSDYKFPLSNLDNFIRIQKVLYNDLPVKYKIVDRNIEFDEEGTYVIKYLTYPDIDDLFEEIDFLSSFSPDVLVLGLCSYYALSCGMFDEFSDFHEKYVERAENLKTLRVFEMPVRRWV